MALTVEDGTGISTADSYLSEANATTYHTSYGNDEWANRPDLHELALRNATSVLDQKYGRQYRGNIVGDEQALLFPRTAFTDSNGRSIQANSIPLALEHATAELALLYIQNDQILIENRSKEDSLQSESVSVGNGAVQESKSYFYSVVEKKTTKSDMLLAPLLNASGGQVTAQRG